MELKITRDDVVRAIAESYLRRPVSAMGDDADDFFVVGTKYFIRTLTYHYVGRVSVVTPRHLVLGNASWVADSGRWHEALKSGELNEVEPFVNTVYINRDSIVDATLWGHELPDKVE